MRFSAFAKTVFALGLLFLAAACATGGERGTRDLSKPGPAGNQRIVFVYKPSGERIDVTFRRNGMYDAAAFEKIDHMFRDRHNGETYAIDPQLIELIAGLRDRMVMAQDTPIELLSGYRSPESNAILSHTNKYVAKQSYHMRGMAADIRIPEMNSRALELVAKTIQKGGVALYPDYAQHVHVDTGPVRGWEVVKGFEAGLEKRERKERAAEKTALLPIADSLPPVTVTPATTPTARIEKNAPMAAPVTAPARLKPLPKAQRAKPVYQKKSARGAKPAAPPVMKKAPKNAPPAEPMPAPAPKAKPESGFERSPVAPLPPLAPEPVPSAAPIPPDDDAPPSSAPADAPDMSPDGVPDTMPDAAPDTMPDTKANTPGDTPRDAMPGSSDAAPDPSTAPSTD